MKRLVSCLSIVVLVLLLISPTVYAGVKVEDLVVDANQRIEQRIAEVKVEADQLYASRFEKTGQDRAAVNHQINSLIAGLISETNAISAEAVNQAAGAGAKVICTYVHVEIAGRWVRIDPLIVCNE